MKNGSILGIVALTLAATLSGCGRSPEPTTVAKPAAVAMSYPAPEVEVDAQPMLASYDQPGTAASVQDGSVGLDEPAKPKKHSHKHSHHKKVDTAPTPDSDMGYMAADDPKLLEAEIANKEKTQGTDWKDWVAPQDQGPEGH